MKILVLDTLGDSFKTFFTPQVQEKLASVGQAEYLQYARTPDAYEELKEKIRDMDVMFCGWGVPSLGEDFYEAANALKVIAEDGHHLGYVGRDHQEMVRSWSHERWPYYCEAVIHDAHEDDGTIFYVGYLYIIKQ